MLRLALVPTRTFPLIASLSADLAVICLRTMNILKILDFDQEHSAHAITEA
jgi:hypothetical protein